MKFTWTLAPAAFLIVLGFAQARDPAQTDESRWSAAIQTFSGTLDGSVEKGELAKLVSDHSWVAPFARNRAEAVTVLPERLAGMTVVGAHAYLQPAISAATDLIADVTANPAIAASVRAKLVPAAGRDVRSADATMARWFATALEAQPGDPVAVIALYDPGAATAAASTTPTLVLVIVRGEIAANGTVGIARALYGSIESAVR